MKKLLLFVLMAGLFVSCEKNLDQDGVVDASKRRMLMDKAWQMTSYTVNPDIDNEQTQPVDVYTGIPECTKDNYFIFNDSFHVSQYDHYVKCSLSDPDTLEMFYQLYENETQLRVWQDNDDPDNTVVMQGNMTYPSVNEFILTWHVYDENTELTAEHVQTFRKVVPN